MKTLYEPSNAIEAHMLQDLLQQEGISTRIQGAYLQGAVGELPASGLVHLVVEDDDTIRQVIRAFLVFDGFAVDEASNGIEALSNVTREKPQLIITDFSMPHMDGVSFLRQLRAMRDTRNIPVILLTGYSEWAHDALDGSGNLSILPKPMHRKSLLAEVHKLLDIPE
jgi:CheY-like chemotaxis protein